MTTTLYRFYGPGGELLYVGIAMNPVVRWQTHRRGTSWWSLARFITLEHFASRDEAAAAELEAIESERPLHNRANAVPDDARTSPNRRGVYRDIMRDVREAISAGQLPPGARLPTVDDFARDYDCSTTPVKYALRLMDAAGIIETHHGVGSFVAGASK